MTYLRAFSGVLAMIVLINTRSNKTYMPNCVWCGFEQGRESREAVSEVQANIPDIFQTHAVSVPTAFFHGQRATAMSHVLRQLPLGGSDGVEMDL